MGTNNRTLLEKAHIAVADLSAGGLLQPEQADKFIQLAIKKPKLLQLVHVSPMKSFKQEFDKMRFSGRVLRPGTEAVPLPNADWAKPDFGMFTLDVQLFRAEVRLSDESIEDQIERGEFQNTIMTRLAEAVGRDMEEVAINGDVASADPLLKKLDGILKQSNVNIVDGLNAKLSKSILRDMLRAMPDEFGDSDALHYFTNRQARIDYRDSLADRATALGDMMLQQRGDASYSDYPVMAISLFPVNGSNNTQALLTDPDNIYLGILRDIRLKVDEDISAGVVIIVATVRFDVKLAEASATVKAINVKGA